MGSALEEAAEAEHVGEHGDRPRISGRHMLAEPGNLANQSHYYLQRLYITYQSNITAYVDDSLFLFMLWLASSLGQLRGFRVGLHSYSRHGSW